MAVAAMIPTRNIEEILMQETTAGRMLLVSDRGAVFGGGEDAAQLTSWFHERFGADGPADFFEKEAPVFSLDGKKAIHAEATILADRPWWIVFAWRLRCLLTEKDEGHWGQGNSLSRLQQFRMCLSISIGAAKHRAQCGQVSTPAFAQIGEIASIGIQRTRTIRLMLS